MSATLTRVPLCTLDEIPVGLGRPFQVGDKLLAVFRTREGMVFALDGICPHRGGPLADGMLAGEQVVCPYHTFKFHRTTGDCDQPGVCAIATYPVEVANGSVFVTV